MLKKYKKAVLLVMIIIIAILMILNLSYSFYGSLELFPTGEQGDKVKLFSGFMFFILMLIESMLVRLYKKESPARLHKK